jgi:hypothetical protein
MEGEDLHRDILNQPILGKKLETRFEQDLTVIISKPQAIFSYRESMKITHSLGSSQSQEESSLEAKKLQGKALKRFERSLTQSPKNHLQVPRRDKRSSGQIVTFDSSQKL